MLLTEDTQGGRVKSDRVSCRAAHRAYSSSSLSSGASVGLENSMR
jgi:hypothetical protein